MTENRVRQYHVCYHTEKSIGEITITQDEYIPINSAVLESVKKIIRESNHLPKNAPVVIVCWQRYEQEDEE